MKTIEIPLQSAIMEVDKPIICKMMEIRRDVGFDESDKQWFGLEVFDEFECLL